MKSAQIEKAANGRVDSQSAGQGQTGGHGQLQGVGAVGTPTVRPAFGQKGLLNTSTGDALRTTEILEMHKWGEGAHFKNEWLDEKVCSCIVVGSIDPHYS